MLPQLGMQAVWRNDGDGYVECSCNGALMPQPDGQGLHLSQRRRPCCHTRLRPTAKANFNSDTTPCCSEHDMHTAA